MARAFTAADVTQHDSGTAGPVEIPGVAFSRAGGAVEGRGGLIVMASQTAVLPPYQWDAVVSAGISAGVPNLVIMARPCLPAGDASWEFRAGNSPVSEGSPPGSSDLAYWAWIAEEWTNLSYAPLLGSAKTDNLTAGLSSISTGTTGAWSAPYAAGIAAAALIGSASSTAWPTSASWSNGFTETDVISLGAGSAATDVQLRVARKYGTLNDAGSWSATCTFTGSMTGIIPFAVLAVFRAEAQLGDI